MPIFEYLCKKCGHSFETLIPSSVATDSKTVCPACGSDRTARKLSRFSPGSARTPSAGCPAGGVCPSSGEGGCCGGCCHGHQH